MKNYYKAWLGMRLQRNAVVMFVAAWSGYALGDPRLWVVIPQTVVITFMVIDSAGVASLMWKTRKGEQK